MLSLHHPRTHTLRSIIQGALDNLDDLIASRETPADGALQTPIRKKRTSLVAGNRKERSVSRTPTKKRRTSSQEAAEIDPNIIPVGHHVAALVRESEWILAIVVSYSNGTYTVEDADEEEKERHHLDESAVIPTPTAGRKNSRYHCEYDFKKGTSVLSVFPDTTVFYRAVVISANHRVSRTSFADSFIIY